jgi:hypothetical protein
MPFLPGLTAPLDFLCDGDPFVAQQAVAHFVLGRHAKYLYAEPDFIQAIRKVQAVVPLVVFAAEVGGGQPMFRTIAAATFALLAVTAPARFPPPSRYSLRHWLDWRRRLVETEGEGFMPSPFATEGPRIASTVGFGNTIPFGRVARSSGLIA